MDLYTKNSFVLRMHSTIGTINVNYYLELIQLLCSKEDTTEQLEQQNEENIEDSD